MKVYLNYKYNLKKKVYFIHNGILYHGVIYKRYVNLKQQNVYSIRIKNNDSPNGITWSASNTNVVKQTSKECCIHLVEDDLYTDYNAALTLYRILGL